MRETPMTAQQEPADSSKTPASRRLSSKWRRNWIPWILLLVLCLLAVVLRCLHLLKGGHSYIVSADSYYFHRIAELIASGESYYYPTQSRILPYVLGSGLAYPLAFIVKAVTLVSGVSTSQALAFVGKFLPPVIGVANMVVLYVMSSRMYGRRVGLLSAFAWAIMAWAVSIGAAGYLDRDGLSMLLVTTAMATFYLMKDVHLMKAGHDFGWILLGVIVLGFEILLFIEWGFLGPLTLMVVLLSFVAAEMLAYLWKRLSPTLFGEGDLMTLPLVLLRDGLKALPSALRQSSYKPVAFPFCASAIVAAIYPGWRVLYHYAVNSIRQGAAGSQTIGEMQGIGPGDLLAYGVLIIPIVVGLVIVFMRRRNADLLWLSWAGVLFAGGLFTKRLFMYAIPATSVLAGVGFAAMLAGFPQDLKLSGLRASWDAMDIERILKYARVFLALGLIALGTVISFPAFYRIADSGKAAVPSEFNEALIWLRDETPEGSVVMTWWDSGYWIMDVAYRVPVVDNGRHYEGRDKDIARVYCTTDDAEAVSLMKKYKADYLLFSDIEISILSQISELDSGNPYGDGTLIPRELRDSLFARAISGETEFGAGLMRVYPDSVDAGDISVVILALTS